MRTVVISQPMLFPWVGLFEQIRLAEVYVHYDDVQFSKGGFINRVQIKTERGFKWLTVPLSNLHLGQRINEIQICDQKPWRVSHLSFLYQTYFHAEYREEMLGLVRELYSIHHTLLSDLLIDSIRLICEYFKLDVGRRFYRSSKLSIPGENSERVFNLVRYFSGQRYVSGLGGKNYLEHEFFDSSGIRIEYMIYRKKPYPQMYGEFSPYVSILDLIANVGKNGRDYLCSEAMYWREDV
jgi:hypothetical protein